MSRKNLYWLLVICMVFSLGCAKEKVVYEYYKDGNIKTSLFYLNKKDTIAYKTMEYYDDGELKNILHFDSAGAYHGKIWRNNKEKNYSGFTMYMHGVPHGITKKVYEDYESLAHCFEGKLHGVASFLENDGLVDKDLWINDTNVMRMTSIPIFIGDTLEVRIQTNQRDTVIERVTKVPLINLIVSQSFDYKIIGGRNYRAKGKYQGSLYYYNDSVLTEFGSSYIDVKLSDTIVNGEQLKMTIQNYLVPLSLEAGFEIVIGDVNGNFEFYGKEKKYTTTSIKEKSLDIFIEDYKVGYNLVTGIARATINDSIYKEVPFFDDFYVKEKEPQ